jgi:hypothetical protein
MTTPTIAPGTTTTRAPTALAGYLRQARAAEHLLAGLLATAAAGAPEQHQAMVTEQATQARQRTHDLDARLAALAHPGPLSTAAAAVRELAGDIVGISAAVLGGTLAVRRERDARRPRLTVDLFDRDGTVQALEDGRARARCWRDRTGFEIPVGDGHLPRTRPMGGSEIDDAQPRTLVAQGDRPRCGVQRALSRPRGTNDQRSGRRKPWIRPGPPAAYCYSPGRSVKVLVAHLASIVP